MKTGMRICVVGYSRRVIGGMEHNLDVLLPEFERRGHRLQFVYFHDEPEDRRRVRAGIWTDLVDAGRCGKVEALARIRAFHPDLINVHGEVDPAFQRDLLGIAPAAYSVHNYYGTCISGLKTHQFPVIQPCERTFGPQCLLQYFPRRCGGLSPVTMVKRYNVERARLRVMADYDAVIVHTAGMEAEYVRHGLRPARVHGLPYEVAGPTSAEQGEIRPDLLERVNLLFVGRMEKLKGGQVLIASLARVQAQLGRAVELHLAGDGGQIDHWRDLATRVMARNPAIRIWFHGWLNRPDVESLLRRTHLLVVPSLWPEPFGKVGPEAGNLSVPVAAFAVGGIAEWLSPGVNGHMAPGQPPTAHGLAEAIIRCVADRETHATLCQGALASVKRFSLENHADHLLRLFERICRDHQASPRENAVA